MRLLFEIDKKDYPADGTVFSRPSTRAIIIRDGKIAMIYSGKQRYYKLPGGGIEPDEDNITAMVREVLEETGMTVIPESIREYGYVHRIQKGRYEPIFIQDNFYYFCSAEDALQPPMLTEEELAEKFELRFVTAQEAICTNQQADLGTDADSMLRRENTVLQMLLDENMI